MDHSPPAARVVADSAAPRPSQRILLVIAIALFAELAIIAGNAIIRVLFSRRLRARDDIDFDNDSMLKALETAGKAMSVLDLVVMIVIAVGFTLLARKLWANRNDPRRSPGGVLSIVLVATALAWLALLWDGATTTTYLVGKNEWMMKLYGKRMLFFGLTLIQLVAPIVALWALAAYTGVATELHRRLAWIGGLAAAWVAGMTFYRMIDFIESPWWNLALGTLPVAILTGIMATFAWKGRLSLGPLPVAESRSESRIRWLDASRSLGLYGTALLWRLVVAIGAYSLLYVAFESQSFALVKFIGWALPLTTLILGVVMTVGIAGFANQPRSSRGREPAYGAAGLMALGSAIDLALFVVLVRLLNAGRDDYDLSFRLERQLEAVQGIAPWAMILGFAALLLLLLSFRAVARTLERPDLVKRTATVFGLVLGGSALTIGLRVWISGKPRLDQGEMMLVVILILAVVGVIVASYLGLLRRLQEAINEMALAADDEEPPAAPWSRGQKAPGDDAGASWR